MELYKNKNSDLNPFEPQIQVYPEASRRIFITQKKKEIMNMNESRIQLQFLIIFLFPYIIDNYLCVCVCVRGKERFVTQNISNSKNMLRSPGGVGGGAVLRNRPAQVVSNNIGGCSRVAHQLSRRHRHQNSKQKPTIGCHIFVFSGRPFILIFLFQLQL